MRRLLTGTQAIGLGALEGGAHLVAACPGPISGEVLDSLAGSEVCCERVPSERVALEVALGASEAGARALCAMRPGGLEGASAQLEAASRAGAGGLVVVASDDPSGRLGSPSDARQQARAALVPVLEPSDAAECRALVETAFELSEKFSTPVVIRMGVRLADAADAVSPGARRAAAARGQRPRPQPEVGSRERALERLAMLAGYAWDTPLNRVELRSPALGVVTSGIAYGMVRDALPEASVLKLGMVHPVPTGLVRDFAGRVRRLLVVEELEPFIESELQAAGIPCEGRDWLPRPGELTPTDLRRALTGESPRARPPEMVPDRPPELCPGCPHRASFTALKRLHVTVNGDRGCAARAANPPLSAVARAPALGASVGVARGLHAALGDRIQGRSLAVIGDGALLHSGVASLARAAAAGDAVVVLDNGLSGNGRREEGPRSAWSVDLGALCGAMGMDVVEEVDPFDQAAAREALARALRVPGSAAVILRSPCVRHLTDVRPPMRIEDACCNRCGACLQLGCPAVSDQGEAMRIDPGVCAGCGLCAQVCRAGAVVRSQA